jgi:hypothetical protein
MGIWFLVWGSIEVVLDLVVDAAFSIERWRVLRDFEWVWHLKHRCFKIHYRENPLMFQWT